MRVGAILAVFTALIIMPPHATASDCHDPWVLVVHPIVEIPKDLDPTDMIDLQIRKVAARSECANKNETNLASGQAAFLA